MNHLLKVLVRHRINTQMRAIISLTIYAINLSETIRPSSTILILLIIANMYGLQSKASLQGLHTYEVMYSFQSLQEGSTFLGTGLQI